MICLCPSALPSYRNLREKEPNYASTTPLYRGRPASLRSHRAVCLRQAELLRTWKLNSAKSEFGEFPGPSNMTQTAKHEDPSLKVATKMATDNGDMDFDSTYSTDGKETTNAFGTPATKSVAKWEGDTLTIQTKGQFGTTKSPSRTSGNSRRTARPSPCAAISSAARARWIRST